MSRLYYLLLAVAILGFSACDIINPDEEIPAYIYVEPFEFSAGPDQGTSDSKITEVWVFVDGDYLGAYPLPSMIPLLEKGEKLISLRPGIKENGLKSQPEIYPFYAPYEVTLDLVESNIDTLRPEITYKPDLVFEFVEEFEGDNHVFREIDEDYADRFTITTEDVFEGSRSGLIQLDTAVSILRAETIVRYPQFITNPFERAYLEINFKSDVPVFWGLTAHPANPLDPEVPLYESGTNISEEWNKIYINLTGLVLNTDYEEFQVGLIAFIPTDAATGELIQETGEVRIDNVKFIHY